MLKGLIVNRILVFLTIFTVLACPLKCASGVCSSAIAMKKSTSATPPRSCQCCPHRNSPAEQSAPSTPAPSDCCPCQGVCAGAIVEKQHPEMNDGLSHCVFGVVPMVTFAAQRPGENAVEISSQIVPAGCSGRSLRLHVCSLTC